MIYELKLQQPFYDDVLKGDFMAQITYVLSDIAFCKDGCPILGIKKCSPVGGIWGELKNSRTNEEQGGGQ